MKKKTKQKKKPNKKVENKETQKYHQRMLYGLFLMFPIMFFKSAVINTIWFDVFGILSLIGAIIIIYNFVKLVKIRR
ncbi:MAG: hypothetical protein ABIF88_02785 [archaeon]